jgi:hypothetical protein
MIVAVVVSVGGMDVGMAVGLAGCPAQADSSKQAATRPDTSRASGKPRLAGKVSFIVPKTGRIVSQDVVQ